MTDSKNEHSKMKIGKCDGYKKSYRVSYDRVIQSGLGILLGMMTEKKLKIKKRLMHTVREFHVMSRHPNNHACNMTVKNLEYKLIEYMNCCEDCIRGKQKKKI